MSLASHSCRYAESVSVMCTDHRYFVVGCSKFITIKLLILILQVPQMLSTFIMETPELGQRHSSALNRFGWPRRLFPVEAWLSLLADMEVLDLQMWLMFIIAQRELGQYSHSAPTGFLGASGLRQLRYRTKVCHSSLVVAIAILEHIGR